MEPRSTFRSEEKVEVTFESLKRAALEALHVMSTPTVALVKALGKFADHAFGSLRKEARKEPARSADSRSSN
jgi:hypothetical protein